MAASSNAHSIDYWNGEGGKQWVRSQERFDAQLAAFGDAVLDAARLQIGERVIDVGCGTGALTTAAALTVAFPGSVTGIDVSKPMIKAAARHLESITASDGPGPDGIAPVELVRADAQTAPIGVSQFDVAISRFGVMFFDDPETALRNLARAVRPGGRLVFVCWQAAEANPWLTMPRHAVSDLLDLPLADPTVPGPHSMADRSSTLAMLGRAGWIGASARPLVGHIYLGGPGSVDDAVEFVSHSGPIGVALAGRKEKRRRKVRAALVEALAPHHDGTGVSLPFAAWLVQARR